MGRKVSGVSYVLTLPVKDLRVWRTRVTVEGLWVHGESFTRKGWRFNVGEEISLSWC